jgi:hypothetical protein
VVAAVELVTVPHQVVVMVVLAQVLLWGLLRWCPARATQSQLVLVVLVRCNQTHHKPLVVHHLSARF